MWPEAFEQVRVMLTQGNGLFRRTVKSTIYLVPSAATIF